MFFLHIRREKGNVNAMSTYWQNNFFQKGYIYPLKPIVGSNFIKKHMFKWLHCHPKPYRIDDWYDNRINAVVKKLHRKYRFDAIMAEYVFFSKVLENFDDSVLKVIDTHDVFTNRHHAYIDKGYTPQWFSTTWEQESKGLDRAGTVIAINMKDQEIFKRMCNREVLSIGYMTPISPSTIMNGSRRASLLYLGSDNLINIEAINFFLKEIFPMIRKVRPDATLHLVGSIGRVFKNRPGCVVEGRIESLQKIFSIADIMINPARMATGLSIKSMEALGHGKVLLTTKEGSRGLEEGEHTAYCVADTPEEFAHKALILLEDRKQLSNISKNAILFARQYNEKNLKMLRSLFG